MANTRITFTLPVQIKRGLDLRSAKIKKPAAEILRMLVARYLKRCSS